MTTTQPIIPALPCFCASFRRTARALTHLYEEALRPIGLRSTQFTILQVLYRFGEVSQGQLGQILAMDSTTLTRTLEIMRRHGWIAESRGFDRRQRRLRLGKAGKARLKQALPVWENVQSHLRARLGARAWNNLLRISKEVTELVNKEGESV